MDSTKSILKHKQVLEISDSDSELDAAATTIQKIYKSYLTRKNLADCAIVLEELWLKALDFAELKRSSISFFDDDEKPQTAESRWARTRIRVLKVVKELSKDDQTQELALQHWLEAIDPRHRNGHNLHMYYDIWLESQTTQPFFYWLEVGDGKEVNIEKCPRTLLNNGNELNILDQQVDFDTLVSFNQLDENGDEMTNKSEELVESDDDDTDEDEEDDTDEDEEDENIGLIK